MKTVWTLALAWACALAQASDKPEPKKPRSGGVVFVPSPSQESAAERERRLKRECKGRPNGGACLGYAS